MYMTDIFKTSGRASFLIIHFQFLQYYVCVVLSLDAFALFHHHFYCDSFTREEDSIHRLRLRLWLGLAMQQKSTIARLFIGQQQRMFKSHII